MKSLKTLMLATFVLLACGLVWAQDETTPPATTPVETSLTGDWKVMLESSSTRKAIFFRIDEKDGRFRGTMSAREIGKQDLDGRRDGEKLLFWSTYTSREGGTIDTSFKGKWEGEAIVGEARYFDRPYKFRAERVAKSSK